MLNQISLRTTAAAAAGAVASVGARRSLSAAHTAMYAAPASGSAASNAAQKELEAKRKAKKFQKLKSQNQTPPQNHPLYMDIPQALRYLRASAVGQPASQAVISILMTVIPDKGSKPLTGSIFYPKPLKSTKILVFTQSDAVKEECLNAGATAVGGAELLEKIKEGEFSIEGYDKAFATPDMVNSLTPFARTLGVKGLMPMVKRGTVSDDVISLIKSNLGSLPFKQKGLHVAVPVGRCDFSDKEIIANLKAASAAIYESQPAGTKRPNILGQTVINATRGPGIVIDFRP